MKKNLFIFGVATLFFILSSTVTYFLQYITFSNKFIPIIIGFVLFVLNVPTVFLARKHYYVNYITFSISAIALGFMCGSWWIYREIHNSLLTMYLISILSASYLFVFYLYSLNPLMNKKPKFWTTLFLIISLIGILILIIHPDLTAYSFIGYYVLVTIAFIVASCYELNTFKALFRKLCIFSFSIIVVGIIILIIMLDGDFDLDGSGLSGDSELNIQNYKKKMNNNNS